MPVINPYFYALNPDILAYENAWVSYMRTGKRHVSVTRDIIWSSWEQCRKNGLEPMGYFMIHNIGEADLFRRIGRSQEIIDLTSPYLETVYESFSNPGVAVTFADQDGIVLKYEGDDEFERIRSSIGLGLGANMTATYVGTNSIDLAISLKEPVSVTGAEHYCEIFHNLASSSVPVSDYNGKLLGVLSIWCKHEYATPHLLSNLISSGKAIEKEMQVRKINERLIENNHQLGAILESVSDGVVYIQDSRITHINKEMLQLLGRKNADLLHKNIENAIITSPEIEQILTEKLRGGTVKATLYGEKKKYNCIVTKKDVLGSENNHIGQILIFREVEEINKLARTINKDVARWTFEDIVGTSDSIAEAIALAKRAAEHDSRIVIEGESGTGKEMFAQAIHNASDRRFYPFVAIDCGAIPAGLFESTLFGYVRGAFTGAKEQGDIGAFEEANKGTLFLDEVENLSIEMQIKLLRVLQEKAVTRVGSSIPIPVDVRIISATNANLQQLIQEGKFREDLFYRLNVVDIHIPPLRDRKKDISQLVDGYLNRSYQQSKRPSVERQAMEVMQAYDWPGNIRQLYNAIEHAGIMTTDQTIRMKDLPLEILQAVGHDQPEMEDTPFNSYGTMSLASMTKQYVLHVLKEEKNNISQAARVLGVSRATVYKMIQNQEEKHDG